MARRRYTGHCHCKAVTYEILLPEQKTFNEPPEYDFCVDCRRVSGSLLTGWLFILRSQLSWLSGEDKQTLYRSSEHVERMFCSVCGCQMTYTSLRRNHELAANGKEDTIDISLGTLDEDILQEDSSIIPWRYTWFGDVLSWMKNILPSQDEIQKQPPR